MAETEKPPAQVEAAGAPSIDSILALMVGVVSIAALYFGRDVLVPITVAILLSFVLSPLVNFFRRARLGRVFSVLLAVLLALMVLLLLGALIGTQLAQLATRLPEYIATVQSKIGAVQGYAAEHFSSIARRLGMESILPSETPTGPASSTAPAAQNAQADEGLSPFSILTTYVSPVLSPIATASIVFVVTIFALLQKEDLRDRMIRLFGSSDLHRTTVAMDDAAGRLSRYFLTLLTINVGFGAVIGAGLFLIGVPNPILWAILAATLRFIPYVGPIIAAGLPVALAAAVDPGWSMVVWTVLLFVVTELIFNQVVEPLAYGSGTGLSTFSVIVAAIFWGWLWGPVGLILSMPLTLCLVVLGRHVERLEFLDVLLGDRPALSPPESFYQRMLAGDADEAQDHAEILLERRSLSSYYDEVGLKGLQLAANDLERGVLRPGQLERIKTTVHTLVGELDQFEDEQPETDQTKEKGVAPPQDEQALPVFPPPAFVARSSLPSNWSGERTVMCLAGRGELDEAASAMLAQLLRKHGLGAQVVAHEAASRQGIASLPTEGVAMIAVSYLDISGTPSHLRYLLKRLKGKFPGAKILVGLWPSTDSALTDRSVQTAIGADFYSASMRDAVEACVQEAVKQGAQLASEAEAQASETPPAMPVAQPAA